MPSSKIWAATSSRKIKKVNPRSVKLHLKVDETKNKPQKDTTENGLFELLRSNKFLWFFLHILKNFYYVREDFIFFKKRSSSYPEEFDTQK